MTSNKRAAFPAILNLSWYAILLVILPMVKEYGQKSGAMLVNFKSSMVLNRAAIKPLSGQKRRLSAISHSWIVVVSLISSHPVIIPVIWLNRECPVVVM